MSGVASSGPAAPSRPSMRTEARRWLRGEPLHVPSHAMVVHFPAALLPVSLVLDVIASVDPGSGLAGGANAVLALGLAGALVAAGTGLLDWLDMIPGTPRRSRVTRHLLVQLTAVGGFAVALAIDAVAGLPATPPLAGIVVMAAATAVLLVGNHLGGLLVYRDGMRVRTGR